MTRDNPQPGEVGPEPEKDRKLFGGTKWARKDDTK